MKTKVIFLGTRGSVPICSYDFMKYGGDTSCVLLLYEDQALILDAGTGLLGARDFLPSSIKKLSILISHSHLDHIQGLTLCPLLFDPQYEITIYMPRLERLSAREQLARLFTRPLWPVTIDSFTARVAYITLEDESFEIGGVKVKTMPSNHPGGSLLYRLEYGGSSLVYATDYEYKEEQKQEICSFIKGAALLIFDAQYLPKELKSYRGFGHSTWEIGKYLSLEGHVEKTCFFHHDPRRKDAEIEKLERMLQKEDSRFSFAKCREIMEI